MNTSFRLYTPSDILSVLAVHETCRNRDRIDPYSVCYRLPNMDPEQYAKQITLPDAACVAEVDGQIVAHGFMEAWGFEERLYLWQAWVNPAFRGQGIGTKMLLWGERKARELHGTDERAALHLANATETEGDAVALLQNQGYNLNFVAVELAFDATMFIPDPSDVSGIQFLSLDKDHFRAAARALCEANLDSPESENVWTSEALQARIDGEEQEWLERVRESDADLSVIACDQDEVVGVYLCKRRDGVGEIAQVAVRQPWRGRGIARSLAMRSLRHLRKAGCRTVRLFTSIGSEDTEPMDGPIVMYQKFGFYPIARYLRFRKPMPLSSVEPPE